MKLYSNWREILKKAWSIKFGVLATIFAVMQVVTSCQNTYLQS